MFAHSVGLYIKITLTSFVRLCIGVCPSHTTNAQPISTVVTSVEAPYFALHLPLPASKTVLSSWSFVVICALIARGKFKPELEFQAGTISFFQAGTSSYHALYKHDNIGYVEEYAEFGSKRRSLSVSNGRLR